MDDNTSAWADVVEKISTSSAINPSLVLTAICVPCGTALAYWGTSTVSLVGAGIAGISVLSGIIQIQWFTFRDPDRLQHDRHVERKLIIQQQRLGYRSAEGPVEIELPSDRPITANPILLREE